MRKMAYGVTVKDVKPIEGKDRIVYVSFKENEYSVIAQKGIQPNDKLVYVEVDSILPLEKQYEFLKSKCYKESLKGYLIKGMKMCGLYSFGLVFKAQDLNLKDITPKKDYTDILKIRKYEPEDDKSPVENKLPTWKKAIKNFLMKNELTRPLGFKLFTNSQVKVEFPVWLISKSDEENLANNPEWFEKRHNSNSYISVKMEGKSVTVLYMPKKSLFRTKYEFKVFGRNTLADSECTEWITNNIKSKLDKLIKDTKQQFALQGEYCSPKVQNGIYENGTHFYIYKIKNLTTNEILSLNDFKDLTSKFGLETVPILDKKLKDFKSIKDIEDFSDKLYFRPGNDQVEVLRRKLKNARNHEGIVVRSFDYSKEPWSFKVKSKEYQLTGGYSK